MTPIARARAFQLATALVGLGATGWYATTLKQTGRPAPQPQAKAEKAPASVLARLTYMAGNLPGVRVETVTVQAGVSTFKAMPVAAAMPQGPLKGWLEEMLAINAPKAFGCNRATRAQAVVNAFAPATEQQAVLKQNLAQAAANMAGQGKSQMADAAWAMVSEQLDAYDCKTAPVLAAPVGVEAPAAVPAPTDPLVEATPLPVELEPAQPRKFKDVPTRCLGLGTVLCEGGLSEAPPEPEVLPWAERS